MNKEQQEALSAIVKYKSVFITGPGGVGKSYLINYVRNLLSNRNVSVTALTGCASVLINGITLHKWAGINPTDTEKSIQDIVDDMNFLAKKRWRTTHVLVIDEISMLSKALFEKLDKIGKSIRNSSRPFGGIQLIFSGDFYQLPPILNDCEDDEKYAFCSELWTYIFERTTIELTQVMRQDDLTFVSILNKIRKGIVDEEVINILESRMNIECDSKIKPTQLYSRKHEVDQINKSHLIDLPNEIKVFPWSVHSSEGSKKMKSNTKNCFLRQWENDCPSEQKLMMAIGAQVVLLHNKFHDEHNLINGSRGVVVDFTADNEPIVQFKNVTLSIPLHTWEFCTPENNLLYEITQFPLKLAWALTIHKSQGMTLDCVIIDISTVFEEGQAYVALSRVKSLDGLYIKNMDPTKINANKTVSKFFN